MAEAHVVGIELKKVGPQGSLIQESSAVSARLEFSTEHRVIPRTGVPNSADSPTIADYIEAEALDGFTLSHLSQYMIVTTKP